MNRLRECIEKFIFEKQEISNEISKIERERNRIAQQRNEEKKNMKYVNADTEKMEAEVSELGRKIAELGDKSQELQRKIDAKSLNIKNEINSEIDGLISEENDKILSIEITKKELEEKITENEAKVKKYELQKNEFYFRFGRMPELSENSKKEIHSHEEECNRAKEKIVELNKEISNIQEKISELVENKKRFKNNNINKIINEIGNMTTEIDPREAKVEEMQIIEQKPEEKIEEVEEAVVLPFIEEKIETKENENENIVEIEEINIDGIEPLEELNIEELNIAQFEPITELSIDDIEPIEELNIEEIEIEDIAPIEELNVEEFKPVQEIENGNEFETEENIEIGEIEPITIEEIEEVAPIETVEKIEKSVQQIEKENNTVEIEEIKEPEEIEDTDIEDLLDNYAKLIQEEEAEKSQAQEVNINIEEQPIENIIEETVEEINPTENIAEETVANTVEEIAQETEETENTAVEEQLIENMVEEKAKPEGIINFGERVMLNNIIVKIENGELVYKAQLSNGDVLKVYPCREESKILERDKENRSEIKEILINYAIAEYRILDKKVVKKVDPAVCELLVRFAKKYNYDAQNLIYSYAMTFSKSDEAEIDSIPQITYNMYFTEGTNITKKERDALIKICKNARKNERIEIIGYSTGLSKIKYMFKRTMSVNNANALPEGKY